MPKIGSLSFFSKSISNNVAMRIAVERVSVTICAFKLKSLASDLVFCQQEAQFAISFVTHLATMKKAKDPFSNVLSTSMKLVRI